MYSMYTLIYIFVEFYDVSMSYKNTIVTLLQFKLYCDHLFDAIEIVI